MTENDGQVIGCQCMTNADTGLNRESAHSIESDIQAKKFM